MKDIALIVMMSALFVVAISIPSLFDHYLVRGGKSVKVKNCRIVDGAVRYTTHHNTYHVEACVKHCACVRTGRK